MDQDVWDRDDGHLAIVARMAAAALASALLTATVVIAIGHTMIDRRAPVSPPSDAALIRTGG